MDLFVTELLGYGDLQMAGQDVAVAYSLQSLPFLSLFGGDGDWFGNALMVSDTTKFISLTEKTLQSVALNSAGRLKIEAAIKADLAYILKENKGSSIEVQTFLISDDRLEIKISINGQLWNYGWETGGQRVHSEIDDEGVFTEQFTDVFS